MFWCQVIATVIAGTVQLGVQTWMFNNIRRFLHFSCIADIDTGHFSGYVL